MMTSAAGRAAIERREGRRLAVYRDSRGILTIGVGHTGRMSPPPVTAGMAITEAQCDAMLATDLAPIEAVINAKVTVPISQNEFDALVSLGFNIGATGLTRSRAVRLLNQGDVAGAANAFLAWSKPAVLAARRREEMAQFCAPDSAEAAQKLANARAHILGQKAAAARSSAHVTAAGGGAAVVAGAGVATTTAGAHHLHLGLIVLGIVVAGAALDGLFAWLKREGARTLAANAALHVAAAHLAAADTASRPQA